MTVQTQGELDDHYTVEDPWRYKSTPDDAMRVARLLAALPDWPYGRVLDIGCGNGFLTSELPGKNVLGVDISERAIDWARLRASERSDSNRFCFERYSIFDLDPLQLGRFDLIIITGVLYPQYIGKGFSIVRLLVDRLLEPHGVLATVHIDEWCPWRFPYTLLHSDLSPYRQYFHRLEVFLK